jgi:hypothetical protein
MRLEKHRLLRHLKKKRRCEYQQEREDDSDNSGESDNKKWYDID